MITCIDQIRDTRYFFNFMHEWMMQNIQVHSLQLFFMAKALYLEAKVFFYMPLAYIFFYDFGICRNSHTTTNKT